MTTKYTQIVAFKVDEATERAIVNLLDQYDRETYPTRSDLLRALLEAGLKKHWNKINRENNNDQ